MLVLTKARDIPMADRHVKILVHGKSGAGKTTLGAMMPRPLVMLTEANGLASILAVNPDAVVIRTYDPAAYGLSTAFEVVQEVIKSATSGALANEGIESLVADSMTEIQRIIRDQILREKGVLDNPGYVLTQQDWGLLTERMRRFARSFRDVPLHTLGITLSSEERDEDGAVTSILPQFEGKKLPGEIAQFFSAVGYAYKRTIKVEGQPDGIAHEVAFQGPSKLLVKPVRPLRTVEPADPRDWIARILAFDANAAKAEPVKTESVKAEPAKEAPAEEPAKVEPVEEKAKVEEKVEPTVTTRRRRTVGTETMPG